MDSLVVIGQQKKNSSMLKEMIMVMKGRWDDIEIRYFNISLKIDPDHLISDYHISFQPNITTVRFKSNMILTMKIPMCIELACNYMRFCMYKILSSSIYVYNITLLVLGKSYGNDTLSFIYCFCLFYFFNIIFIYREIASYARLLKCTSLK